ncbi:MAG: GreA/GreB family elongation factor [Breznakibacter sp.]
MGQLIINSLDSERILSRIKQGIPGANGNKPETLALIGELKRGKILDPTQIPADVVTMHSVVRIKYLDNGKTFTFQLVYPEEANVKEKKISIFAPTATALLGYRKGDVVKWNVPGGVASILIEDIEYQPESAGDYHL